MDSVNYFFSTDFTAVKSLLESLEAGHVFEGEDGLGLVSALAELDQGEGKQHWVCDEGSGDWNLHGVLVEHNGPNDVDFPTNALYQNVLILKFPTEDGEVPKRLYLQYN